MSGTQRIALALAVLVTAAALPVAAKALLTRQYYSSWSYHPQRTYYYSHYYYKPTPSYDGYLSHHCIYYPSRPRYVYYYNPYAQAYWGRFDLEAKDENKYSLLAEKDRKKDLAAIPEDAFPKPGKMPAIPEAKDGETILPIKELPPKS
jgi:hypothetical protein